MKQPTITINWHVFGHAMNALGYDVYLKAGEIELRPYVKEIKFVPVKAPKHKSRKKSKTQ